MPVLEHDDEGLAVAPFAGLQVFHQDRQGLLGTFKPLFRVLDDLEQPQLVHELQVALARHGVLRDGVEIRIRNESGAVGSKTIVFGGRAVDRGWGQSLNLRLRTRCGFGGFGWLCRLPWQEGRQTNEPSPCRHDARRRTCLGLFVFHDDGDLA